jgi:hypothetical protein
MPMRNAVATVRIDRGDESETHLLRDDGAGDLQARHDQPHRQSEHRPDEQLLPEHPDERTE